MKNVFKMTGRTRARKVRSESGLSLIETMIAAIVLVTGVLALMGVFTTTTAENWNQGDRATRTTEYAEDKIEQLLSHDYNDTATNTGVYPPTVIGGTGLAPGGGVVNGAPVAGYVDYIDNTGAQQAAAANAAFVRQWSVAANLTNTLKTITVVVRALNTVNPGGVAPSTTLVVTKSIIQ